MYMFSKSNKQMEAVMLRMFQDIGITVDQVVDGNIPTILKDSNFYQRVINAFENFKLDYILIHKDIKTKKTFIYSATSNDDTNSQVDKWSQQYDVIHSILKDNEKLIDQTTRFIRSQLQENFNPEQPIESISNEELQTKSENIAKQLEEKIGIKLSPLYILY